MKKQLKALGVILSLTMSATMLSGCGKKVDGVDQAEMIEKYAAYCDLPNYVGLEYTETKTTVTDADVQNRIDSLLSGYTTTNQIMEGTVKEGDSVNIDFVGTVDGVEFEGGNSGGAGYDLTIGSGTMIPGFEEGIIGHDVGETFDIDVTFPDGYGNTDLAGQDAVFAITINYISESILPEYNDAFVASYTDASTVAEYEESVRNDLVEQYAESDKSYNQSAVMQVLVDSTVYNEYPQQDMKKLIDDTISQEQQKADSYGYSLGDYVTAAYGFSDEDSFRKYVQDLAEDYMKEKIAVCAVAKDANINVTKEDVDAYRQKIMDYYGFTDEADLEGYYTDEDMVYYALAEKVVDYLLENGKPVEATDALVENPESTDSDATSSDAE